jgi:hypothetical protein
LAHYNLAHPLRLCLLPVVEGRPFEDAVGFRTGEHGAVSHYVRDRNGHLVTSRDGYGVHPIVASFIGKVSLGIRLRSIP